MMQKPANQSHVPPQQPEQVAPGVSWELYTGIIFFLTENNISTKLNYVMGNSFFPHRPKQNCIFHPANQNETFPFGLV